MLCHTGNCIFIDKKYLRLIKIEKTFLNNKNVNLLFDKTWLNKKKSLLKNILKVILPVQIIDILRIIKKKLRHEK